MHIFLDGLETFRMIWKLSGLSGNFLNDLETFRMILKLSRWSRNFPDGLKTFQMVWKLSRCSGIFLNGLQTFRIGWKDINTAKQASTVRSRKWAKSMIRAMIFWWEFVVVEVLVWKTCQVWLLQQRHQQPSAKLSGWGNHLAKISFFFAKISVRVHLM